MRTIGFINWKGGVGKALGNILVKSTDAEEVANIRPMTAAQVIQQTRYPRIDLITGGSEFA